MHITNDQIVGPKLGNLQPDLVNQQQQQQVAAGMIFMSGSGELTNGGDIFDGSTEPIVYMSDNRMPVIIEFNNAIIYIIFIALLLAFLVILPGIRRTKLTSFIGLVTLLIIGASILLALQGSYWLTGSVQVHQVPYSSLTKDTITGKLSINIGLSSTNVTLIGHLNNHLVTEINDQGTTSGARVEIENNHLGESVYYNERFHWDTPDRMATEHELALRKGLPYPILTVTEFLSQDSDGFNWTRQLRQAGQFTSFALYASLVSWCLTTIIMCALPVYLPHMMQITGALMMSSVWINTLLIQSASSSAALRLGETSIEFAFGHTYVITFVAGLISMFAGVLLFLLRISNPNDQFTIMDSDKYLKDRFALYNSNMVQSSKQREAEKNKSSSLDHHRNSHVVIPISDIEAKFKPFEQL